MNGRRTMVLMAIVVALAGCAATAPERTDPVEAKSASDVKAVAESTRGVEVEAEGTAHLGDEDKLGDAKKRAWKQATERALAKGVKLHVEAISEINFGELCRDCVIQAMAGTLADTTVIEEGLEKAVYRIKLRATVERQPDRMLLSKCTSKCTSPALPPELPEKTSETTDAASAGSTSVSETGIGEKVDDTSGDGLSAESPRDSRDRVADPGIVICCREFPPELSRRVRPVLEQAPGVTRVDRVRVTDTELCYRIHHDDPVESIETWVESKLRTSAARPFTLEYDRDGTINLIFDAGFD